MPRHLIKVNISIRKDTAYALFYDSTGSGNPSRLSYRITPVQCQGARSLANDLSTGQGVVSSRAASCCDLLRLSL